MEMSWISWARGLRELTPTEKLLAYELAIWVDARGVAMASVPFLVKATGRSARSIHGAIASLRERELLQLGRPAPRRERFAYRRFQLAPHRGRRHAESQSKDRRKDRRAERPRHDAPGVERGGGCPRHGVPRPALGQPVYPLNGTLPDNEQLRTLIRDAHRDAWSGAAADLLAAVVQASASSKFRRLIAARQLRGQASEPWETLSVAWQTLVDSAGAISRATEPWALWVHLAAQRARQEDGTWSDLGELPSGLTADTARLPWAASTQPRAKLTRAESAHADIVAPTFGIDDFTPNLVSIVHTMIDGGVADTLAWSGTCRVLELAHAGPERRHWAVTRDAKLAAMGVTPAAARTWMTALVGSRRISSGLLVTDDPARHGAACAPVIKALAARTNWRHEATQPSVRSAELVAQPETNPVPDRVAA